MFDWFKNNMEWVFSGIGVFALGWFFTSIRTNAKTAPGHSLNVNINNHPKNEGDDHSPAKQATHTEDSDALQISDEIKRGTRILFVDDDTRFKVVKILKNAGWPHVKIVKDISSLDAPEVLEAKILFIDIQGVGKQLEFSDEGLGLALAIKQKYPPKRVVIYSSQTTGERFHEALRTADYSLPKNADPYEFITIVEEFAVS